MKDYNVWYEDISEGCHHCGEEDHEFEMCPLRVTTKAVSKIKVEKNPRKTMTSSSKMDKEEDSSGDDTGEEQGWTKVVDKKGKKPLIIRKPKKKLCPRPTLASGGIVIREPADDALGNNYTKEDDKQGDIEKKTKVEKG